MFLSWIDVLDPRLLHLIKWPARVELIATMPLLFHKYFGTNVAVIIDCFEVFINKPSNHLAKACTWSQFRHHSTIKFLIGIRLLIGLLLRNKYRVLESILPLDYLITAENGFYTIDKMAVVCCALLNACDSVVPIEQHSVNNKHQGKVL